MKIVCCILCVVLLLTGCGLSDEVIPLINGYELWKDGTCCLHTPDSRSGDLDVTAYCIREEYILLEGVPLAGENRITAFRGYYVINTLTGEAYGMFDTPLQLQLQEQCEKLGIFGDFDWIEV